MPAPEPRPPRLHGRLLAAEVGELAGVSGTTVGQWARRGYIASSRSAGDPRVYAFEDALEAAVVALLLDGGVRRPEVRRVVAALAADYGPWPLTHAPLAITRDARGRARVLLDEPGATYARSDRGWQLVAAPPPSEPVRPRVRRTYDRPPA